MAGDKTDLRVVNLGLYRVVEGAYSLPHPHLLNQFSYCIAALRFQIPSAFVVVRDADPVRALESKTKHNEKTKVVCVCVFCVFLRFFCVFGFKRP